MKIDAFLKTSGIAPEIAFLRDIFRSRRGKLVRVDDPAITPKRTDEHIRQAIREGRVAGMSPRDAGA
ncbi:hypothetical protein F2P45_00600 [Massilia sp. CCM 8733]|uniref:Uncharacterized protein n=1 Tax=Massilia mucilaginosa TaxID=2609282 RepID=A0ABX0NL62_9BURK|nr:hypothetical protein [Massilia mucilaginosa]NHZ87538.1 hypothetical protein [Massilia mucilaginosa]